jgi:putative tricarboxylic transport membrane protein
MKINDRLAGLVLLALAVVLWSASTSLPNPAQQVFGPSAFPQLVAALLGLCSALLLLSSLRAQAHQPLVSFAAWTRSPVRVGRFLLVPASVAFYVLTVDALGFLPTAALVLLVLFVASGLRLRIAAPLALLVSLVTHSAFYLGLSVQLPWGLLAPIAW